MKAMEAGLATRRLVGIPLSTREFVTSSRTQQPDYSRLAFRRVTPVPYCFRYARLAACAVSQLRDGARVPASFHQG